MEKEIHSFTTTQAARLCGLSNLRLDHLARSGVLVPSEKSRPGKGRPRLYTFGDIVILRALRVLLDTGLPVRQLSAALKKERKRYSTLTFDGSLERYLISDGKDIWFKDDAERVIQITAGDQLCFGFILDLTRARQEVIDRKKTLQIEPTKVRSIA